MRDKFALKYKSVEQKIALVDWEGDIWIDEKKYHVMASRNECGWEHVSVSSYNKKIPTWDVLSKIKECFWDDEEDVYHMIPKKSDYVNIAHTCMHMWKIRNCDMGKLLDDIAKEHK